MNLPDFLTRTEKGGIRIAGHRIGLEHVVEFYDQGYTAEMIQLQFPTVPLALIYKALAFYLDNRAEVDAHIAEIDAEVERQVAAGPRRPSLEELRENRLVSKP